MELDQLQKISAGFSYDELSEPASYARTLAIRPDVIIGNVTVTPKKDKSNLVGSVDRMWGISPDDPRHPYRRANISNYLYILEVESPFVVVTQAEFKPVDKTKPHEYGTDRWTFKAEITSREPAN